MCDTFHNGRNRHAERPGRRRLRPPDAGAIAAMTASPAIGPPARDASCRSSSPSVARSRARSTSRRRDANTVWTRWVR